MTSMQAWPCRPIEAAALFDVAPPPGQSPSFAKPIRNRRNSVPWNEPDAGAGVRVEGTTALSPPLRLHQSLAVRMHGPSPAVVFSSCRCT